MSLLKKDLTFKNKLLLINRIGQTLAKIEEHDLYDEFDDLIIELQSSLVVLSNAIDYLDYKDIEK